MECKAREDCPEFLAKQKLLRTLPELSLERTELISDMKDLVCDTKLKTVCCRINYEIVGGTNVTSVSQFPYMARIIIKTGPYTSTFCGAALIHINLLLSAKHCVVPFFWDWCIEEDDCYAKFRDIHPGRTNHEKGEFSVPIVEMYPKEGTSDLAVLKLAFPVTNIFKNFFPNIFFNLLYCFCRSKSTLTMRWALE